MNKSRAGEVGLKLLGALWGSSSVQVVAGTNYFVKAEMFLLVRVHMAAVKTVLGSHFGWQVHSPPILEPISVGIGMFTGTIWVLTHAHMSPMCSATKTYPKKSLWLGAKGSLGFGIGMGQNLSHQELDRWLYFFIY